MKLWQTTNGTTPLQQTVQDFTVGIDYQLDQALIPYDIQASIAHAQGLVDIDLLTSEELEQLKKGFAEITKLHAEGAFEITPEQEDGHTAIEQFLTTHYGEVGKKIHTGRSRNDQVLVAMRLWERDNIDQIIYSTKGLLSAFETFAQKNQDIPMPGFTHTQIAMPFSVSGWAQTFAEMLAWNLEELRNFRSQVNRSPLGSAAGFGSTIPLNNAKTAERLGFESAIQSPLTCQNTRGLIEAQLVSHLVGLSVTLHKFANDLVWFTSSVMPYFTVDTDLTTGSSIMPQKQNLDPAELLRASHAPLLGYQTWLQSLTNGLISGYHRDLQLSKEPTMKAVELTHSMLGMAQALLENITPNQEILEKAMSPEIYATDRVNELVMQGVPFRDAYLQVKEGFF